MSPRMVSPCCGADFEHVSKNPGAVTARCGDCGGKFTAADADEVRDLAGELKSDR